MNKNSNKLCELPFENGGEAKLNKKEQSLDEKQENSSNQPAINGDSFGKFNSAEALLKAYNGLEAEFTKRSQELKRLERELEKAKAEQAEDEKIEVGVVTSEPAEDETVDETPSFLENSFIRFILDLIEILKSTFRFLEKISNK
jgi:hypothetical protein